MVSGAAPGARESALGVATDGADQTISYVRMDAPLATTASRLQIDQVVNGGPRSTVEHDNRGRTTRLVWRGLDGEQRFVTTSYDQRDRVSSQSLATKVGDAPESSSHFEYDERGRVTLVQPPAGGATHLAYVGRTTMVTDPRDNIWRREYDVGGRPKQVRDRYGGTICFYSGAFGLPLGVGVNQASCTDAPPVNPPAPTKESFVIRSDVDSGGHLLALRDPNLGTREYRYGGLGHLRWSSDAAGGHTTYERDVGGRLIRRVDADGETTFAWDDDPTAPNSKYGFCARPPRRTASRPATSTTRLRG